jgi:hypothetical protein
MSAECLEFQGYRNIAIKRIDIKYIHFVSGFGAMHIEISALFAGIDLL